MNFNEKNSEHLCFDHLDETGAPCSRHPRATADRLLQLAAVGSRTPSFNHDIASKIQGLLMAIDEVVDLATGSADLREAAKAAHDTLHELNQLLQQNRALTTKAPVAKPAALGELIATAARRVAVTLQGELPTATVNVPAPLITQALALALDIAAGIEHRRSIEISVHTDDGAIELGLPFAREIDPEPGTALAIAGWIFAQARGAMRCLPDRLAIRLPS